MGQKRLRLSDMRYARFLFVTIICVSLFSCSKPTATNSEAAPSASAPVDYSPKLGVAVRTDSHACIAIRNGAIAPNAPVTLVNPVSPQTFVEAQISGNSKDACPISQEVPPGMESYDIALPNASSSTVPKQTPLIAVIGTAASSTFNVVNSNVQADLSQTHSTDTFRACGANDGVYLTVWKGVPLTGTLVWSGHYYEAGNPGTLPTCTTAESTPHP